MGWIISLLVLVYISHTALAFGTEVAARYAVLQPARRASFTVKGGRVRIFSLHGSGPSKSEAGETRKLSLRALFRRKKSQSIPISPLLTSDDDMNSNNNNDGTMMRAQSFQGGDRTGSSEESGSDSEKIEDALGGGVTDASTKPQDHTQGTTIVKMTKFIGELGRFVGLFVAVTFLGPLAADEIEARYFSGTGNSVATQKNFRNEYNSGGGHNVLVATEDAREGKTPDDIIDKNSLTIDEKRQIALTFVTDVVNSVGPSVVRVDTETHVQDQTDSLQPPGYIQQGQGSGLIFSEEGLILTNAHVVEDATKVSVTLTNGRVYTCKVMGTDEIVDIAVLRILSPGDEDLHDQLPVADLGDSDLLQVGRIVIAVGSPGGLDNTVTMGIVSGLQRSSTMVGIPHKKVDYIQTDAAINPGNSGGPLIDVESGKVMGINAAIRAHMEGTSFAIPINRVREIMSDLAEGREIHHGYLGLGLATCTPDSARQENLEAKNRGPHVPEVYGAIVHKVFPKTPADIGGIKENDVILEIGQNPVQSADDARRLIDLAPVGEDLEVGILRRRRKITVTVRPVDLANRLREMRKERAETIRKEQSTIQEFAPFRSLLP